MHHPLDFVPAGPVQLNDDADGLGKVRHRHRQRLAHAVACRVIELKGGADAVFLPHAVAVFVHPAGFLQKLFGKAGVVVGKHRFLVKPGQGIAQRIRRGPVSSQDALDQLFPGDAHVEGFADGRVTGHVVAYGIAVFVRRAHLLHGKGNASVVTAFDVYKLHAVDFLVARHRGSGNGHVHRSRLGGGEGGAFAQEQDGEPRIIGLVPVVILIRRKHNLLPLVPLDELIGT